MKLRQGQKRRPNALLHQVGLRRGQSRLHNFQSRLPVRLRPSDEGGIEIEVVPDHVAAGGGGRPSGPGTRGTSRGRRASRGAQRGGHVTDGVIVSVICRVRGGVLLEVPPVVTRLFHAVDGHFECPAGGGCGGGGGAIVDSLIAVALPLPLLRTRCLIN